MFELVAGETTVAKATSAPLASVEALEAFVPLAFVLLAFVPLLQPVSDAASLKRAATAEPCTDHESDELETSSRCREADRSVAERASRLVKAP